MEVDKRGNNSIKDAWQGIWDVVDPETDAGNRNQSEYGTRGFQKG